MESESLQASSRRWMGAALAAFAKGATEHDFAVHHAGVAVEHLMKAYLSGLHPALIVDGAGRAGLDSLLHATGHGYVETAEMGGHVLEGEFGVLCHQIDEQGNAGLLEEAVGGTLRYAQLLAHPLACDPRVAFDQLADGGRVVFPFLAVWGRQERPDLPWGAVTARAGNYLTPNPPKAGNSMTAHTPRTPCNRSRGRR